MGGLNWLDFWNEFVAENNHLDKFAHDSNQSRIICDVTMKFNQNNKSLLEKNEPCSPRCNHFDQQDTVASECMPSTQNEPFLTVGNDAPVSAQMIKALASNRACRTRAILTDEQAVRIYQIKLDSLTASNASSSARSTLNVHAGVVARAFGVSDKAIRDIWKGRTWLRETMHLDPARAAMAALLRPPGRPKGRSQRPADAMAAPATTTTAPLFTVFSAPGLPDYGHGPLPSANAWPEWALAEESGGPPLRGVQEVGHEGRDFGSQEDQADPSPGDTEKQASFNRVPDPPSAPPPPPPPTPSDFRVGLGWRTPVLEGSWPAPPRCDATQAHRAAAAAAAAVAAAAASFALELLHGAAAGLPASSRADDPFHDDWAHW